jgi:hypothetical protein
MLRASFIPSRPQRQLRDLIRYRRTLTQERTRESSAPRNSRRRPDQAVGGDQRHLRRLRPGHARRPDRPARRDPRRRYHRRPGHHRRDRHRHDPLPHPRPPGVLGQVRAPGPPVRRPRQDRHRGKGNPWPGGTLGEAATGAARTKTFLASRYKRIVKRRDKNRALVAVGNSILTITWHLLSDPSAHFTDLGPGWHDRLAPLRRKRQLIAELERLSGKKVTLQDAI